MATRSLERPNNFVMVRPIIEARMQKYTAGEIHFNLMAMIHDRTVRWGSPSPCHNVSPSPLSSPCPTVPSSQRLTVTVTVDQSRPALSVNFRYNNQLKDLSGLPVDTQVTESGPEITGEEMD